jgi:dipeptidyl aminopeptidase/acylaminoacyl peptidase
MLAGGRELSEPRPSPDGRLVAYGVSWLGRSALVVQPVDGGPERLLTTEPRPRVGRSDGGGCFDWLPDGSGLVYVARDGNLWRQALAGGGPVRITDHADDLTAESPAVSPDGSHVAYVVDTAEVRVTTPGGRPAVVVSEADFCLDPCWRADGLVLAWHEWDAPHMPWDESRWVARPVHGDGVGTPATFAPGMQVQQPRFAPVGDDLVFLGDAGGWLNLRLAPSGRATDRALVEERHEHGSASWGPGQRSFAWSPTGDRVAFCRNEDGFGRLCTVDVERGVVEERARGWHFGLGWRGERLVAVRAGARTPTEIVAYDTRRWSRTTLAVGPVLGFDAVDLPEPELVAWTAGDGTVIPGRLYRSPGDARPGPLLVWIHGGPTGQATVTFNPRHALWLARGWSILTPDHRGSTGHGRAFTRALRGQWGELDVSDCAAGAAVASERGWARAGSVVAMGGSAGGFTALNLVLRHPELFSAAVVSSPVTDLADLAASTHRFEAHYNDGLIGPRPLAEDAYRERSPLARAIELARPVLVFHGTEDPVVPIEQSRRFVDRAVAAGGAARLVELEGEGHGVRQPENVATELAQTEDFLTGVSPRAGRVRGSVDRRPPG